MRVRSGGVESAGSGVVDDVGDGVVISIRLDAFVRQVHEDAVGAAEDVRKGSSAWPHWS